MARKEHSEALLIRKIMVLIQFKKSSNCSSACCSWGRWQEGHKEAYTAKFGQFVVEHGVFTNCSWGLEHEVGESTRWEGDKPWLRRRDSCSESSSKRD